MFDENWLAIATKHYVKRAHDFVFEAPPFIKCHFTCQKYNNLTCKHATFRDSLSYLQNYVKKLIYQLKKL